MEADCVLNAPEDISVVTYVSGSPQSGHETWGTSESDILSSS